ncbi:MAG: hypothetical protein RIQ54_10 [Candidatus Parcubacteria bacterium]
MIRILNFMYTSQNFSTLTHRSFVFSRACLQVTTVVSDRYVADLMRRHALGFLEGVSFQNFLAASSELVFLSHLIQLSADLHLIHVDNASTLSAESDALQKDIQRLLASQQLSSQGDVAPASAIPLSLKNSDIINSAMVTPAISSGSVADSIRSGVEVDSSEGEQVAANDRGSYSGRHEKDVSVSDFVEDNSSDSDKRQTAILSKIQELGNCRLKDLIEYLPNVSERTIRYDLQKLTDSGVIERVGGGGPFSFYRSKS